MTPQQPVHTARVVVGVDRTGSHNHQILAAAFEQARSSHADLCIVHALTPDPPSTRPLDAVGRRRQYATRHDHMHSTTADLRRQIAHLGEHGTVHYDIRYGDPATLILAAAQHADLIVVGTRDPGHGSAFLLGPVSQDIAVHSTCPVLLIPTTSTTDDTAEAVHG